MSFYTQPATLGTPERPAVYNVAGTGALELWPGVPVRAIVDEHGRPVAIAPELWAEDLAGLLATSAVMSDVQRGARALLEAVSEAGEPDPEHEHTADYGGYLRRIGATRRGEVPPGTEPDNPNDWPDPTEES